MDFYYVEVFLARYSACHKTSCGCVLVLLLLLCVGEPAFTNKSFKNKHFCRQMALEETQFYYPLSFRDLYRLFTRNQLLPTAKNQLPQASTALQVTVRKKRWRVLSELRQFKTCYIKMFFYKFEIFEENRFLLIESFDFQVCFYQ